MVALDQLATRTTTLRNAGGATLDTVALSLTGTGYSRDGGTCPAAAFPLAAGQSCTVVVRFAPTALGAASGSLMAASGGNMASVVLSGTGMGAGAASIGFTQPGGQAGGLDFGNRTVGSVSTLSLTISNITAVELVNLVVAVEGGFSLTATTCGANLAAGASCQATVRFAPIVVGAAQGLVRVTANGGVNATAPLTGNGVAAPPVGQTPPPVLVPTLGPIGLLLLLLTVGLLAAPHLRRGGM